MFHVVEFEYAGPNITSQDPQVFDVPEDTDSIQVWSRIPKNSITKGNRTSQACQLKEFGLPGFWIIRFLGEFPTIEDAEAEVSLVAEITRNIELFDRSTENLFGIPTALIDDGTIVAGWRIGYEPLCA